MKKMSSREIRDKFLQFFQNNDHMLIENSSIVPKNDPTLLFINSGMAPLKKYFTGEENPPSPRLCDIQSCIRTIDIDDVGDKHHLTSFQMLGSWSINNYFKEKAIKLAYEYLTSCLKIPVQKLYVTIFSGDDELGLQADEESKEYWIKAGIDKDHVVACGKEDNFWGPTSETGPCGPCTEVFYDTGEGEEYVPGGEFDTKKRYIEIWNAGVFMQLNKNADGTYSKLSFTSVDTGAGLERLSMVLNGAKSVYETDLLLPIKEKIISELSGKGALDERDILIMTDHLRTSTLILSEKVKPSNEGRGYIPRKLIRKCVMIVDKAKVENFNFINVLKFILDSYADMFPKFEENRDYIISEFQKEYEQFEKVLKSGLDKLGQIKDKNNSISAEDAFELVTTYGLPIDIIKDFSKQYKIELDEKGFKAKIEKHKAISRNSGKTGINSNAIKEELFSNCDKTEFCGYENTECKATVVKILKDGNQATEVSCEEEIQIVLNRSCMYAESGGQCADKGFIYNDKFKMCVNDVKKTKSGVFVHFGKVEKGTICDGENVNVKIDEQRRQKLANNHSCVHLLQSALRKLYGNDLHQEGSKVEEDRLRFDFNYDKTLSREDIYNIENIVNGYIRENVKCVIEEKNLSEAVKDGAIALFDSKYGEKVRVVTFGDISKELCGGTHTTYTGNIGQFAILTSESIGKGVKRITAITGNEAVAYFHNQLSILDSVSELMKVKPEGLVEKLKKQLSKKSTENIENSNDKISEKEVKYFEDKLGNKCGYIFKESRSKTTVDEVFSVADKIKSIVLCVCGKDKKQIIICSGNKELYKADEILKSMAKNINAKGGGNNRMASGGVSCEFEEIKDAFISEMKK